MRATPTHELTITRPSHRSGVWRFRLLPALGMGDMAYVTQTKTERLFTWQLRHRAPLPGEVALPSAYHADRFWYRIEPQEM